eukprot:TRINITY_DN180_c0_g1_i31.p1 TRINITY_DN180_c0_g1~~TRINITY_DN180_c0_g1_i31.p1  ORF type:complete len:216 (-),score=70.07 TRINITY_DN180_c0_g1_i31:609-1256(-)
MIFNKMFWMIFRFLDMLVGQYPMLKDVRDPENGNSLLHVAVEDNFELCVERLIVSLQVNVNLLNKKGESPLLLAVRNKNIRLSRMLLEHGANPNPIPDKYEKGMGRLEKSCFPLFVACSQNNEEMVSLLIESGSVLEIGFHSNPPPSKEVIKLLLEGGAKPDWMKNDWLKDEETLMLFLENGGDLLSGKVDLRRCGEVCGRMMDQYYVSEQFLLS